ncbi:tetratricopeptide repeat protein [Microbacterium sp. DT81.1]|uniref:tetratricopeptide repeat protein n=1 Tax=Microbacterium sp. DT81.1 TaxID=3393413 RepID=UPI003CE6C01F
MLADLVDWVRAPGSIAVRVIGGQGGAGKTRLGTEACIRLNASLAEDAGYPWVAGFLPSTLSQVGIDALAGLPVSRLIVVDYAETRSLQVAALLRALAENADDKFSVRVLLLVRRPAPPRLAKVSGGSVWIDAVRAEDELADKILDAATFSVLDDAPLDLVERVELYDAATQAFAEVGGSSIHNSWTRTTEQQSDDPDLSGPLYEQPLTVMMVAYLATRDRNVPDTRLQMFDAILSHEARYWSARWTATDLVVGEPTHRQAVALATLTGVASSVDAAYLLGILPELHGRSPWEIDRVDKWLSTLYPSAPGEPAPLRWGPLEPDTLGEHLLSQALGGEVLAAAISPGRDWDLLERPLTVLSRATADGDLAAIVGPLLNDLLPDLVSSALDEANNHDRQVAQKVTTPAALAELCATLSPLLDPSVAHTAETTLPAAHTSTARLALILARSAVDGFRARADTEPATYVGELAAACNNFAIRLSEAGREDEAMIIAEEAVRAYRILVEEDPSENGSALGTALTTLANRLAAIGRAGDALPPAEEAVKRHRDLASAEPSAKASLGRSLNNLAAVLSDLDNWERAVACAEESTEIFRELSESDAETYLHQKAAVLNTYSNQLLAAGRQQDAMEASAEALRAYRDLASANPAAHNPALAMTLNNSAKLLATIGRYTDALRAAEEAVRLRRVLAETNPEAHTPDLATSLNNYATLLFTIGRYTDALPPAEEAVRLRRVLAEAHPAVHTPDLATSLNSYASLLSETGRRDDALPMAEEALRLYRTLAEAQLAAHTPHLAAALNNYANLLAQMGLGGQVIAAADEAVDLVRALAIENPRKYDAQLATSLNTYATILSMNGHVDSALAPASQAVALYRALLNANRIVAKSFQASNSLDPTSLNLDSSQSEELVYAPQDQPKTLQPAREGTTDAHTRDLASALNTHAALLTQAGRPQEALPLAEEAVQLYSDAAAHSADAQPALAMALNDLSTCLGRLGRGKDAIAASEESIRIRRALASAKPDVYESDLAKSLNNYSNRLAVLGRPSEALAAIDEAVRLRRRLVAKSALAHTPGLAESLNNLALRLSDAGDVREALRPAREAVELRRNLAISNVRAFGPSLIRSLNNLANLTSVLGDVRGTAATRREALEWGNKLGTLRGQQ